MLGLQGHSAPYGYVGGPHEDLLLYLSMGQSSCVHVLQTEELGVLEHSRVYDTQYLG